MKNILGTLNLSTQMRAAFVVVVLLTAAIVGLRAIWLLQDQLDRQAWSQVEQGQRTAVALYSAQYREIFNLASLTAQRPTLHELMVKGDIPTLTKYLHTLKDGAGLTRIIVCDSNDQIIATTDEAVPATLCQTWRTGNYQYNSRIPQACLTAYQSIENKDGILGIVFVCNQLDDDFVRKISEETGLEHTLWIDNLPVATSFNIELSKLDDNEHQVIRQDVRSSHHFFEINDIPYYSAHIPLEEAGLSAEVALDVTEIKNTSDQLSRTLMANVFIVAFISSLISVLLLGRINRR